MGKLTMPMAISNSYVSHYQRGNVRNHGLVGIFHVIGTMYLGKL